MPNQTDFNGTILNFGEMKFDKIASGDMLRPPKIACISDSPKLTSGFANVAKPIYEGFVEAGFEIHVFGLMDDQPDSDKTLPYSFWHCDAGVDQLLPRFLMQIQPDIIFMLCDPGAAIGYMWPCAVAAAPFVIANHFSNKTDEKCKSNNEI